MSDAPKKPRKTKAVSNAEAANIEAEFDAAMAAKRQEQQIELLTAPKKRGRPSKYSTEVANKICDLLSEGTPLRAICRLDDMPDWRTVYEWIERDEAFSGRVARAREHGVEAIAQDTLAMIDEEPRYVEDAKGGARIDPAYIQWTKLRTEQRMKLLSCWSPNRYGARVQVAGDKNNPLAVTIEAKELFDSVLQNAEMKRQVDG